MPKVCVPFPAVAGRSSFALFEQPWQLGSSRPKTTDFWKLEPLRGTLAGPVRPMGLSSHLNTVRTQASDCPLSYARGSDLDLWSRLTEKSQHLDFRGVVLTVPATSK